MRDDFEDYRMGHLVRSAEVWKRLLELGASEKSILDFDFSFDATSKDSVAKLQEALSDYNLNVTSSGFLKKQYQIAGSSGGITWTEEQLLKWVDYLIQVGEECGCTFQGCGASSPDAT